ncbi:hypothetical protein [Microbacterium sp. LWH12-1.2]|uniref:hypothetical protein n=1 Tax=Microbacterium sp. LWH12-1.2 TaxID=3135259 RepID=UPI003416C412
MPRSPRPLPTSLSATFTQEEARAAGVTPRRLRAQDIARPYRGLLRKEQCSEFRDDEADAVEPPTREQQEFAAIWERAREFAPLMVEHAFFVGRTAAKLRNLPVDAQSDLEVGVTTPNRAPRRRGIKGRQLMPELVSVREVGGVRIASPASTWAMLASELTARELVVLGDAIVRVPRDDRGDLHPELALATIDQLRAVVDAGRREGRALLRAALGRIRVGSASPLETEYRMDAEDARLPEPVLDLPIRDVYGRLLGITEIAYPEFRVLVEIEGDQHRVSRQQWNRDIEKYAAYVAEGYEVVRLTSAHIRGKQPRAVAIVREVLTRRNWRS